MDLAALLTYLQGRGDPLIMDAADTNLPAPLRDFLTGVPGQSLTISPGADGLHLDGTVLTISGTSSAIWPVTGRQDLSVPLTSAQVRCTSTDEVSGTMTGHLPLNASVTAAPVTVASLPPAKAVDGSTLRPWQISLTSDASGVTPADLLLLGKEGAADQFPQPPGTSLLESQLVVPASDFGLTFYPGTEYDAYLTFTVNAPAVKWTLVPDLLAINGVGVSCRVSTNAWAIALASQLVVASVPMVLTVYLNSGTIWVVELAPANKAAFPGLAALAAWVGGATLASDTTRGLDSVGFESSALDLAITKLSVRFDWAKPALQAVQVVTLLTLHALQLDVMVQFPDLTISGCLHDNKPIGVGVVLSSFGLPTDALPDGMKVVTAAFTAQPTFGVYRAALAVDLDWQMGPLTMQRVRVSVCYGSADGLTGQIEGLIQIGDTIWVELMAGYGGPAKGWEFSGRTEPGSEMKMGDLLNELSKFAGIGSIPPSLASLTLTDLSIDYKTGTGEFNFTCAGGMTIADTPVSAVITINVTGSGNQHSATFGGQLTVAGMTFAVVFDVEKDVDAFIASYAPTGSATTKSLHDLVGAISTEAATYVPSGLDIGLRDVKLAYLKPTGLPGIFAFGLDISVGVDLSQLPLIGDKLPPDENIAVDGLQILYCSDTLSVAQLNTLNKLLKKPGPLPFPAGPLASGVSFTAELAAGGAPQPVALAVPPAPPPASPANTGGSGGSSPQASTVPAPAAPAGFWLNVGKQLGAVQINRVGLLYQAGALMVGFDAAITLGPFSLSLDGLAFGSPLTAFTPAFQLNGLGLAYASGPLTISGALLRVPVDPKASGVAFQFDGTVQISAESFELAAIGSYAQLVDGTPSLWVFAQLNTPLGGPPAFFVEGLMGGFGFNRDLTLPAPAEVTGFPLIALGAPPGPGQPATPQDPTHVLQVLEGNAPITPGGTPRTWISPSPGMLWLAAGLEFTSFELVRTKAVLVVQVSNELRFAVLGSSTLQLPQPGESSQTYAYAQLGIEAVLEPQQGYFGLTAILSPNSYVIAPACHLTGGFAIAAWFGDNPHAGEFVLTLGGYHPAFPVPAHFPVVPRLGFVWAVSDTVTISGAAYAALTTTCVMAGGRLEAVFQDGGLRAWFTVGADLLISWRPFFFTGQFAVSIGVAYTFSFLGIQKTISVSVGAGLELWGPPTGGTVTVTLWVVSFTVRFGADRPGTANAALEWPDFAGMLPPATSVTVSATTPLLATLAGAHPQDPAIWVVRATGFSFATQSALPASQLRYGPPPKTQAKALAAAAAEAVEVTDAADAAAPGPHDYTADPINIRPMNRTEVTSAHYLTVRYGSPDAQPYDVSAWTITPRTATVPDSLWGAPPSPFTQVPARPAATVLPGKYVGYDVQTPPPALGNSRGRVLASALAQDVVASTTLPLAANAAPGHYTSAVDAGSIGLIAQVAQQATVRSQLITQIQAMTGFSGTSDQMNGLAAQATDVYSDPPLRQTPSQKSGG